jgi:hypothetical protein
MGPWHNGSASDSSSEGCMFDSRRVQTPELELGHFFLENTCLGTGGLPGLRRDPSRSCRRGGTGTESHCGAREL